MANTRQHLADSQRNDLKNETYWAKRLKRIIALEEKEMPFIGLGEAVTLPKRQGTLKYTIKRYLKLPVDIVKAKLAEGVAPDFMKMEGTKVTGQVAQYGAIIGFTDVEDDVHFDNLKEVYQPEFARHANELRERIVLEAIDAEASKWIAGGDPAEANATGLTLKELRRIDLSIRVNLRRGHKAGGGKTVTVVAPQVMQDLLDDADLLTNMLQTGQENAPIRDNTLRNYTVYNLNIQESLLLSDVAAFDGVDTIYYSYMMGEDPYQVITMGDLQWKEVPFTATHGDPLAQNSSIGYKFWIGAKVIDPVAIVQIASKSAEFGDITEGDPLADTLGLNKDATQTGENRA